MLTGWPSGEVTAVEELLSALAAFCASSRASPRARPPCCVQWVLYGSRPPRQAWMATVPRAEALLPSLQACCRVLSCRAMSKLPSRSRCPAVGCWYCGLRCPAPLTVWLTANGWRAQQRSSGPRCRRHRVRRCHRCPASNAASKRDCRSSEMRPRPLRHLVTLLPALTLKFAWPLLWQASLPWDFWAGTGQCWSMPSPWTSILHSPARIS
mmetsp:Transcript_78808/g.217940  ORF Transcript_78808/g.217940 Transcript_78808/m.217940 type:complete len:210 (-) Transcript_78808:729-1358(-)